MIEEEKTEDIAASAVEQQAAEQLSSDERQSEQLSADERQSEQLSADESDSEQTSSDESEHDVKNQVTLSRRGVLEVLSPLRKRKVH